MSHKVFLSVGRAFTPDQERFIAAFEDFLKVQGLTPETVGRTYVKNQQPLRSVAECMRGCSGVVVLAFERVFIAEGKEKRASSDETAIQNTPLPTVWNQIEAAMAYTLDLPLLVVVERGLRSEGLLEKGYDWYVKSIQLRPGALADMELVGLVSDWKAHVEERSRQRALSAQAPPGSTDFPDDIEKRSIIDIVGSLKPGQLWTVLVAIVSTMAAVAAVAFKLGGL